MERKVLVVCFVAGLLGILSAVTGFVDFISCYWFCCGGYTNQGLSGSVYLYV